MRQDGLRPTAGAYSAAVRLFASRRKPVLALELALAMRRDAREPRPTVWTSILEGSQASDVTSVVARITQAGYRLDGPAVGAGVSSLCYGQLHDAALELALSGLGGGFCAKAVPSVAVLGRLVTALAQAGQHRDVVGLLDACQAAEVALDARVFTTAILAAGRRGKWKKALKLLKRMLQTGVAPDVPVYNAAIR
jgi:pentatricopeptide repeat protein